MSLRSAFCGLVFVLGALAPVQPGFATDIGTTPPPAVQTLDIAAIKAELTRYAILYRLRAAFDVVAPDDIEALLKSDVEGLAHGEDADTKSALDGDLIAEGSYYLVSLRYLVEFGGANWPEDRPAADYKRDALALLESLQAKWLASVSDETALLSIMRDTDKVNGWTEGYTTLPPELDHFAGLEELVNNVFANYGPQADA